MLPPAPRGLSLPANPIAPSCKSHGVCHGMCVLMPQKPSRSPGRNQRGRPPVSEDDARKNRVVTFVTNQELEQLSRIANTSGKSMSAVCHRILVDYLKRQRRSK